MTPSGWMLRQLQATNGDDRSDEMPTGVLFIYLLAAVFFVCLMLLVGFQITLSDLKTINVKAVATIIVVTFIVMPACALGLCVAFQLETSWALGVMLYSVTPQTTIAALVTASVGGDTALAVVASVCSCATSIVATPGLLQLSFIILSKVDGEVIAFEMPVLQIIGSLLMLMVTAAVGVAVNEKFEHETLDKIKKGVKVALICCFAGMVVLVFVVDEVRAGLLKNGFYTGDKAGTMWAGAFIIHLTAILIACVAGLLFSADPKQRDAVIVTLIRRNPAITTAIAITFSGSDELDFGRLVSMTIAITAPLDPISVPVAMAMRKQRFGKWFGKPPPDDGVREKDADSEAIAVGVNSALKVGEESNTITQDNPMATRTTESVQLDET